MAETTADPNSYGFRESRGGADAVAAAFIGAGPQGETTKDDFNIQPVYPVIIGKFPK